MRAYKVNEKLMINLDKIVALEDIVASYKLVMEGNTILTLEKEDYLKLKQELEIENDNDLFVNMGITDKPIELDKSFGWGDK